MKKRILDTRPAELIQATAQELLDSIRAAEGRTIISEVMCPVMPLLYDVTNAELAAACGADIILLNLYNAQQPFVFGVDPEEGETVVQAVKRLSGRAVAVNLEPIDTNAALIDEGVALNEGSIANRFNARAAYEQGVTMIVLTGNPKAGVTNHEILKALQEIRSELGNKVILVAGKMHCSGTENDTAEGIVSTKTIEAFLDAGVDIILLPAPGTVPGVTLEFTKTMGDLIHAKGALLLTAIGTSQEGADPATIRSIALNSKMAGSDIHHIGDAGYFGIAVPENIIEYSKAIRGVRHTYRRMAMR